VRELKGELACISGVRSDHETRVVAGDRADDDPVLEPVERSRDRGRGADVRLDDNHVLRGNRSPAELPEQRCQRLTRIDPPLKRRYDTAKPAERVAHLLERQFVDVARDSRLRDMAADALECVEELLLGADPQPFDEARDELLTLSFREPTLDPGLHTASIPHPAET
jgi:hypothetical protein